MRELVREQASIIDELYARCMVWSNFITLHLLFLTAIHIW